MELQAQWGKKGVPPAGPVATTVRIPTVFKTWFGRAMGSGDAGWNSAGGAGRRPVGRSEAAEGARLAEIASTVHSLPTAKREFDDLTDGHSDGPGR